jgi:hypothetical protein
MTTIRFSIPNVQLATQPGEVPVRASGSAGAPALAPSDISGYFTSANALDTAAVDALRALPVDEQRRRLEAMTLDAKASRDPLAAQRVVDLYLALGKAGGPEALAQLGPRLASDIESLIDRADSASVANVAGTDPAAKAAIERIRNGTFTAKDLEFFTDDNNKANLSQLTAEDKALLIQALISTGTGSTDSAKFQDARRVINVLNSMRSVTEYNQVMSIVGAGDANKAFTNIENWVGGRAALKPSTTSEDITASLGAAFGSALAKPAAHSARRETFAALTRDVGTQPPGAGADTVNQSTPALTERDKWRSANAADIEKGRGAFEREMAKLSADGSLSPTDVMELAVFAADPSMLIERFMAGDPEAIAIVSEPIGMERMKLLVAKKNALLEGLSGLNDDEIKRGSKFAGKIGQIG